MRSPSCLSAPLLNQLVDFNKIKLVDYAIENDLDFMTLIPQSQPFQNGGRSNFWDRYKTCTIHRGTTQFCVLLYLWRTNNF